eukprot:426744_1
MLTSTLLGFSFIYHQTYSESLFTLAGPFQPQSDTIIGYSDVVDSMIIEFDMTFHSIVNSWGGILSIGADYDERLPMILMQNNENWLNFNVATITSWSDDSCDSWAPSNGRFTNGENYHLRFFFNQSACGYYINGTLIHANYQHAGHPIIGQRPIYIDTLPHSSAALPADITIRNLLIWTPTVNAFVTLDPTPSPTQLPTFSTNTPTNAPVTEPPTTSGTTFPTNTPTTNNPTTNNPTTNTPTTYNPTTSNPTTNIPTTLTPTTNIPTTSNPTTNIPTTVNPTNNPITYQPTTSIPTTDSPTTSMPTVSSAPTVSPITPLPTSDPMTLNPTTRIPTEAGESGEIDMDTTISDGKLNKNIETNSSNGMNVMFYIIGAATCCICILLMIVFLKIKHRKQQKDMSNNMKHSKYNNTINSQSPTSQNNSTFVTGFSSNATQISEEPQYFQNHLSSVIVGSGILMDDIIDEMDGNTHVTAGGPIE